MNNNIKEKITAEEKEITQESLQERIQNALEKANRVSNNLYGTEEEVELQEEEMRRIEEGFKTMSKKLVATDKNRWGYSPSGYMSKALISKHLNSLKNGLYSIYPIPCKKGSCPYGTNCIALQNHIEPPYGEPCVIETNKIEQLIIDYSLQYKPEYSSSTDKVMIRELIQLEILMDRCQNLMAQEASPLQEVIAGIAEDGTPYTQPVVSRYYDAWERMSKRKQSLLNDLEGTRRSKRSKGTEELSDAEIIMSTLGQNEDFMKVEERPERFREKDETIE